MVDYVTSLSRNGLRDWLIQRISALLLAVYTIFLVGFLILHSPLHYAQWQGLFANEFMRVFTVLALISLVYHTWVGIWTVLTDYVHAPRVRLVLLTLVVLSLLGYLIWGVGIVWGMGAL